MRYTTQIVRDLFAQKGAELISDYIDMKTPLEFVCSNQGCNNIYKITLSNYLYNRRNQNLLCPKCNPRAHEVSAKREIYSTEKVKKIFSEKGAILISEYKSFHQQLEVRCSNPECQNLFKISLAKWKAGQNKNLLCPKCNPNKVDGESRLSILREEFSSKGAELLNTTYSENLEFICSNPDCSNVHHISYYDYKDGINPYLYCPKCNPKFVNEDKRMTFLMEYFAAKGAKLLNTSYSEKLDFLCSNTGCGRKYHILYSNLIKGSNPNLLCEKCLRGNTLSSTATMGERRNYIDSFWLKYILEFWNVEGDYASHHIKPWGAYPELRTSLTNGFPLLRKYHSKAYVDINGVKNPFHMLQQYLNLSNYPDYVRLFYHTYSNFRFLNLDSVATELIVETTFQSYLLDKKKSFSQEGVLYIPIYFEEMLTKQDRQKVYSLVKARISRTIPEVYQFTGDTRKTYYARNLVVKEVSFKDVEDFFNNTHMQGAIGGKLYIGLYSGDNLIMGMILGKARYGKYEWEILRMSCLLNTTVVGGASKLFKYFLRKYKPASVVTYCDLRFSELDPDQTVYPKLGFKFSHVSSPNYRYYKSDDFRSFNRQMFQKFKLRSLLDIYDENLSEAQNMENNGYSKLYDCGNLVFEYISR